MSDGAAGVEAERGQAALDFLHFRQRRRALAPGKFLHERLAAHHAVAQTRGHSNGRRVSLRG